MVNNAGINRVLNIIITLLVVAVITLSTVFFIRFSQQSKSAKPASVSKVERHSSAKESSQSTDEADGTVAMPASPTPPNDSQQVSGVQPDVAQRANGVIVDNGMNFNYRAAQALGIIPNEETESSVMDFYANCQDYDNGFIYNGQKYNTQVIQDGHENEYHCNILVTPDN